MTQTELKKMLKPLVKQLVKEAMQEELTGVISEIIKQTGRVVETKQTQQPVVNEDLRQQRIAEKQKAFDERKKMLEEVSKKAYGGINIFEGTTPIASAGNPEQKINEARAGDPLGDADPSDPGVDIGGLLRMTGGWKQIK
jgi:hypothetical protein